MGLGRGGRGLRWRGGRSRAEWLVVALLSCGQRVNCNTEHCSLGLIKWSGADKISHAQSCRDTRAHQTAAIATTLPRKCMRNWLQAFGRPGGKAWPCALTEATSTVESLAWSCLSDQFWLPRNLQSGGWEGRGRSFGVHCVSVLWSCVWICLGWV